MARLRYLIWRAEVVEKLFVKHGVTRDEVEEVAYGRNKVRKVGRNRYLIFGQTDAGRYLLVVLEQERKGNGYDKVG